MSFILVIPARFKSTRFPGKPLVDLDGKSMIQRTYEQCTKAVDASLVVVATEDHRIVDHCVQHQLNVSLTSDNCLTGTDRVAEVSKKFKADYYINVQGDEPLVNPKDIKKMIQAISDYPGEVINGYCSIETQEDYDNVSIPKVVFRPDGRLLYMSRRGIPGNKDGNFNRAYRQVCIYAFPYSALMEFSKHKLKAPLEQEEDIEILRFLELNYEVRMLELSTESIAVDTKQDVEKVLERLSKC